MGLFLHQTRKSADALVTPSSKRCQVSRSGRFARLVHECQPSVSRVSASQEAIGVGIDPVFSPSSRLFNGAIAGNQQDWYNSTPGSPDLNINGYPLGFFRHPLPGWQDGFTVLFDTNLPQKRLRQMLLYLRDGRYLSQTLTSQVTATMLAYNADGRSFGYWQRTLTWDRLYSVTD